MRNIEMTTITQACGCENTVPAEIADKLAADKCHPCRKAAGEIKGAAHMAPNDNRRIANAIDEPWYLAREER